MASPFDLLLVSNSVENQQDNDAASAVVASMIEQQGGLVYSDLSSASLGIVSAAFAITKFDAFLDTQWDPPKFPNSIATYRLLSNDELSSFATEMNATFETVDFDNYVESPEVFKPRIKANLFAPFHCLRIVVASSVVIRTCMELLGQRSDAAPLLSLWKIWSEVQRGAPIKQVDSWTNAQEIVGNAAPSSRLSSISISQSVVFDQPMEQSSAYAQTARFLQEQVQQLSKQFSSELGRELESVLAAYRMEGAGPAEHVAREVNDTLQGLRKRFGDTLLKLEERLRDADEYKRAQKAEIDQVARDIRIIAGCQTEVGNLLKRLEDSLGPTIDDLQRRLAAIDTQQAALRKEVLAARQSKLSSTYPLTITKIMRMEDSSYVAEVTSRKHYPVYGQLAALNESGEIVSCSNTIEFRGKQQLNLLTLVGLLQPRNYQVVILHFADQSEISARAELEMREDSQHLNSLLYRERDMQGIENALMKERGLAHVLVLRKLVAGWRDAAPKRLDDFLAVFKDRSVEGEEALLARLRAQGFTV